MRPTDLPLERWVVPAGEPKTIAILTGGDLRHDRFALRIIESFGSRVLGWYRYRPAAGSASTPAPSLGRRGRAWLAASMRDRGLRRTLGDMPLLVRRKLETRRMIRLRARRQSDVEKRLFGDEVMRLGAASHLRPVDVADPNAPEFVETMTELSPWLLLTLGGPLYRKPLLGAARGATLNQHAGWSPEYRGTNTTDWALHQRRLDYVGNTVHLAATGADSGWILRRAHPALTPDDTPESIFARVVAVGTELMIEVVQELIDRGETLAAPQPRDRGRTYLSRDLGHDVLRRTARDFEDGWLPEELRRAATW
ncbi:hypothetical protein ABI59_08150 [Acidobacteria bacterium Mor1]|nr:hypothetical protein ABI59_08150 [Acidobacteria bacterium Mor1]